LYELGGDFSQRQRLLEAEGRLLGYVHGWGNGPVFYTALGHDTRALSNPNLQRLLVQAAHWLLEQRSNSAPDAQPTR
jgi:type 1 glutamine amidotransferase